MNMNTNTNMNTNMNTKSNVLSEGIEIIGTIEFQNDMHIDGKVEGEIKSTSGQVTIGEKADISGNIKAGEVHVYGTVNGNISSKLCHLNEKAIINGNITTEKLSMEQGAKLTGRAEVG